MNAMHHSNLEQKFEETVLRNHADEGIEAKVPICAQQFKCEPNVFRVVPLHCNLIYCIS